jgi:hypothetical protein
MERFQALRAAALYCERRLDRDGFHDQVDRVFSAVAIEIFTSTKRAVWMPLIESIQQWLRSDASSCLLAVCGQAYRLADNYRIVLWLNSGEDEYHWQECRSMAQRLWYCCRWAPAT